MKPLLLLLIGTPMLLAQTASIPPVASMTPESMHRAIKTASEEMKDAVLLRKLVADAIALKRVDLIQACFIDGHTVGDTLTAVAALPNNEVKQKAVIMMMRTPSATCWPSEKPLYVFSGVPATGLIEPIVSTIPSLLPGESLTKEMVATQAARHQLADRLLAALIAKGAILTEGEKALLSAPSPTAALNDKASPSQTKPPVPAQALPSSSAKPSSAATTTQKVEAWPQYLFWLIGGTVAVIVLTYVVMRKPG